MIDFFKITKESILTNEEIDKLKIEVDDNFTKVMNAFNDIPVAGKPLLTEILSSHMEENSDIMNAIAEKFDDEGENSTKLANAIVQLILAGVYHGSRLLTELQYGESVELEQLKKEEVN